MSDVNWMRWNAAPMDRASAAASVVLPTPGHVLDQQVPAGDQADDGEPHHLRLSDQRAPDVFLEAADGFRRVAHRIPLYRTGIFRPARVAGRTLAHRLHWPRDGLRSTPHRLLAPRRPRGLRLHLRSRRRDAVDGPRRHEPVTLSQGRFGPVEALPRILDAAAPRRDLEPRSSSRPGWPSTTRTRCAPIVDGGHEIGCHGDEHERVSELRRPTARRPSWPAAWRCSRALGGRRPIGYRAPAWQLSARDAPAARAARLRLLLEHDGPALAVPASGGRGPRARGDPGVVGPRRRPVLHVHRPAGDPAAGSGAAGLAHRVRGHHGGARGDQLHLPPADHRPARHASPACAS